MPYVDQILYLPAGDGAPMLGEPRDILGEIDLVPPLVRLGKELGWRPLPLTIKEGLRFSRRSAGEANKTDSKTNGRTNGKPYNGSESSG